MPIEFNSRSLEREQVQQGTPELWQLNSNHQPILDENDIYEKVFKNKVFLGPETARVNKICLY